MNSLPHEFVLRDLTWYICLASSEWVPIECWKTPGRHLDNSWMALEWVLNIFWMSSMFVFPNASEWEFRTSPEWLLTRFCANSECEQSESWITLNKFWRSWVLIDNCMTHERLVQWVPNRFCKVTPEWLLSDSCMTNEYLLNEFWSELCATPEWLLNDLWMSSVHVLNEFWMSSEWDPWMPSESVLKRFRMSSEWLSMRSERVLNDLWIKSEWVGNGTSTAAEWLPMSYR